MLFNGDGVEAYQINNLDKQFVFLSHLAICSLDIKIIISDKNVTSLVKLIYINCFVTTCHEYMSQFVQLHGSIKQLF